MFRNKVSHVVRHDGLRGDMKLKSFTPVPSLPHSYLPISPVLCSLCPPQETGRYPAYKEMVSEYCWLDRCK
jgi:hypothetical protein